MNPTIQAIDAIILYLEAAKAKEQGVPIPADNPVYQILLAMMTHELENLLVFWKVYRKVVA